MHNLVLHDIDDKIVAALEAKAIANGISTEEQILKILTEVLLKQKPTEKNFTVALMRIPNVGIDDDFER